MKLKLSNLLAFTGLAAAAEQGWTGVLNIKTDAGLGGTVTVVNDTAVMITGYTLKSASAPALHWWGSTTEDISKGFRVNSIRVSTATPGPTTIMILLDSGKTASDFTYFGLWCESLSANFGEALLQASSGTPPGSSPGGGSPATGTTSPGAGASATAKSSAVGVFAGHDAMAALVVNALLVAAYLA